MATPAPSDPTSLATPAAARDVERPPGPGGGGRQVGRPELVSPATRRHVREFAPDIIQREIDGMWNDHGFHSPAPVDPTVVGARRSRYDQYLRSVDWTERLDVDRALRVFEATLEGASPDKVAAARRVFERDGLALSDDGHISWVHRPVLGEDTLAGLRDPAAIRDQLDRVAAAVASGDVRQAIGSAKELIEATACTVLSETFTEPPDNPNIPRLVRAAEEALRLHPRQQTQGPDGSESVRKILGSLSGVALGVAELRNAGYGTGHGAASVPSGLGVRHARLAVGAAAVWCGCLLDTLGDPGAPWRRSPP